MDDLEDFVMRRLPTANRPLLGLTVLVVEDSRYACEAIRLMCLRSGARIRRADSLRSAARHLRVYRPSVAIVDIGLPDGSGMDLIADLAQAHPKVGVLLGLSGEPALRDVAIRAGADGFLDKPVASVAVFQEAILSHLPREVQPRGPRAVNTEILTPDLLALKDDLAHVTELLRGKSDSDTLDYVAQFLGGIAVSADDGALLAAARALSMAQSRVGSKGAAVSQLNCILQDRLAQVGAL
jgi:DNA-binding response OmpR family regulator